MSKRSNARRRAIVAARSRQARINESKRKVTTLRAYNDRSLNRLTDAQLRSVAKNIGNQTEQARQSAIKKSQDEFYNVPIITITKRDRMYAARPLVPDSAIQAAPSKQRKLLRQQQKRRKAARDKIARAQQNLDLLQKRTIQQQRELELAGEDVAETGYRDRVIQGNSSLRDLVRMTNVLKNDEFVQGMSRTQLIREIKDSAERIGKKTSNKNNNKKKKRKIERRGKRGSRKWNNYVRDVTAHKLRDAFGNSLFHSYTRLTDKQRYYLQNATNFMAVIAAVIDSLKGRAKRRVTWRFNSDSGRDKSAVEQQLKDFIAQAKKYA